jgi:hypothetical protein
MNNVDLMSPVKLRCVYATVGFMTWNSYNYFVHILVCLITRRVPLLPVFFILLFLYMIVLAIMMFNIVISIFAVNCPCSLSIAKLGVIIYGALSLTMYSCTIRNFDFIVFLNNGFIETYPICLLKLLLTILVLIYMFIILQPMPISRVLLNNVILGLKNKTNSKKQIG